MSDSGVAVRAAAARALARVRFDGESLKAALPPMRDALADPRDRALCEAIAFEACRWLPRYELLLRCLLQRPIARPARTVHGLLLAALAQLDAMQMPPYAVIDASVEASRLLRQPHLASMVNAVLRRYLREREALHAGLADSAEFRHAHPEWLLQSLQQAWPDHWPAIIDANNTQAPMWLRINRRRSSIEDSHAALAAAGIGFAPEPLLPWALRLPHSQRAEVLPGWEQGLLSVQDGAAQCCIDLLDLRPGQRVLDACAAPGGKAAAVLEAADVDLLALDRDAVRLRRVGETLKRLGLDAQTAVADAAEPARWWDGQLFDRILLDAPCSATGVIRRQPDIRWHRRASDIEAMVATQRRLLDALWPLLRPGGRLVYATCSVLPDENARQIDAFLDRHRDAAAIDPGDRFGQGSGVGRQRLPGELGMDGFFYAILQHAA